MNKNLFKNFDWSLKSIAKGFGLLVLALIALGVVGSLLSFSMRTIFGGFNIPGLSKIGISTDATSSYMDYGKGGGTYEMGISADSVRSYYPYPPQPSYATGTDAEEYEIKEYSGTIKTRSLDDTCGQIEALKAKDYVIFDNANRSDTSCNYSFKVAKANADEIVAMIDKLDPENFSDNVSTIKPVVEGISDEITLQENKLKTMKLRMEDQINAYDEIFEVAKRTNNVESMTQIVISKQAYISQIEMEMGYIQENIDRFNNSKSGELDRLDYTFFYLAILKDVYIDWVQIKNNWKYEVQTLVQNFNQKLVGISLGAIGYLIAIVQGILYLFITLYIAKYVWVGVKWVWKGKRK